MKQKFIVLLVTQLLISYSLFAGTKTWIGPGGGNWSAPANWTGGIVPGATDTVIVNTATNINVDVNPTIAGFQVTSSATVTLQALANRTMNIGGSATGAMVFLVNTGCTLTLGSTSAVSINTYGSASTNTALIKGTLILGQGASAWTINNLPLSKTNVTISGTVRLASNNTGSALLSGTPATLIFQNGSRLDWQRDGGVAPNADFQDGSLITVTGIVSSMLTFNSSAIYNGLLVWSCLSQTISGAAAILLPSTSSTMDSIRVTGTGTTGTLRLATNPAGYTIGHLAVQGGTLELSAPAAATSSGTISTNFTISGGTVIGNATYSFDNLASYPMTLTVNGNFSMTGGATYNFTNRPAANAPGGAFIMNVKGNVSQNSGTITSTSGFGSQNQLNMNGTIAQNLQISGMSGPVSLVITNNNGVNLLADLTLPYFLNLQQGYLQLNGFTANITYPNIFQAAVTPKPKVVTNGTGALNIKTITASSAITFPIGGGTATYNPLGITNGGASSIDFSARVENAINPAIAVPVNAINRTWTMKPSVTPSSVDAVFYYSAGDGNGGFNYGSSLELGQNISAVWNVIKTGILPSGTYQANATNITSLGAGISSPFVLGNLGAILAIADGVSIRKFRGVRQAGTNRFDWLLDCNVSGMPVKIELQRSGNGNDYNSLQTFTAGALRCAQPFDYTDAQPLKGINYYRLKTTDVSGRVLYSTIVPLINAASGMEVMNIAPNPVTGSSFKLGVASAQKVQAMLIITDMQGRVLQQQTLSLIAGFINPEINVSKLPRGMYQVHVITETEKAGVVRFVRQ